MDVCFEVDPDVAVVLLAADSAVQCVTVRECSTGIPHEANFFAGVVLHPECAPLLSRLREFLQYFNLKAGFDLLELFDSGVGNAGTPDNSK